MLDHVSYYDAFQTIGLSLTKKQIEDLQHYAQKIQHANKVMNLTAVADDEGILWRHFIDSCQALNCIKLNGNHRIIDIGSGAGFPGLPLAIVSGAQASLLDALNKRVKFLETVIADLSLSAVNAMHGRAETVGRMVGQRAQYDYAFSRAVTELPVLIEYAMPLLKVGGRFIAYKSADSAAEIAASEKSLTELKSKITEIFEYTDNFDINRKLVIVEKTADTPDKYPRRTGLPAKRPLK